MDYHNNFENNQQIMVNSIIQSNDDKLEKVI